MGGMGRAAVNLGVPVAGPHGLVPLPGPGVGPQAGFFPPAAMGAYMPPPPPGGVGPGAALVGALQAAGAMPMQGVYPGGYPDVQYGMPQAQMVACPGQRGHMAAQAMTGCTVAVHTR